MDPAKIEAGCVQLEGVFAELLQLRLIAEEAVALVREGAAGDVPLPIPPDPPFATLTGPDEWEIGTTLGYNLDIRSEGGASATLDGAPCTLNGVFAVFPSAPSPG